MLFQQARLDIGAELKISCIFLLRLTASLILLRMIYNRYAHPARKYPGPFFASCTRLWLGRLKLHRQYHDTAGAEYNL